MPEHFTRNTVEASFWCKTCAKPTLHYVFDKRRGGCQECVKRQEAVPKPKPKAEQGSLF